MCIVISKDIKINIKTSRYQGLWQGLHDEKLNHVRPLGSNLCGSSDTYSTSITYSFTLGPLRGLMSFA